MTLAQSRAGTGVSAAVGTTYVTLGAIGGSETWQGKLQLTNVTTAEILVRAYVADGSWTTGEPTGGTLEHTLLHDVAIPPGSMVEVPCMLGNSEELVVRSNTASSLDAGSMGILETV